MKMETVMMVAAETKAQMESFSTAKLCVILMGYGVTVGTMTRKEIIAEIVDLEVYAFTH
jgi:hypothetical protein